MHWLPLQQPLPSPRCAAIHNNSAPCYVKINVRFAGLAEHFTHHPPTPPHPLMATASFILHFSKFSSKIASKQVLPRRCGERALHSSLKNSVGSRANRLRLISRSRLEGKPPKQSIVLLLLLSILTDYPLNQRYCTTGVVSLIINHMCHNGLPNNVPGVILLLVNHLAMNDSVANPDRLPFTSTREYTNFTSTSHQPNLLL